MKARWAAHPLCRRAESSKEDGCVGGESLFKLMRFPGEPAMTVLAHSLVMLGTVLGDADVVDSAPRSGEAMAAPP